MESVVSSLNASGMTTTAEQVQTVVNEDTKGRFSIKGGLIRANQGHSTAVNLMLTPEQPPAFLYHGTASRFVSSILVEGLKKQARHAVHLTTSQELATSVGSRYGKPVLLRIASGEMSAAGHTFTRSENNVWLVEAVPAQFLTVLN